LTGKPLSALWFFLMIILENQKTLVTKGSEIKKNWVIVDAKDQILGRLATRVAHHIRGKHRVDFSPNQDIGDFVIVINARHVRTTGKKLDQKMYRHHSRHPGGLKSFDLKTTLQRNPTLAVEKAVKRMLPPGPLGRRLFDNLKVYADAEHPHQAQKPTPI
jgi:large subunit ribosomal protein L13